MGNPDMLSNAQKSLLKRAQSQAAITDQEYRASLELITGLPGCSSSTDPRLSDRHLDNLLAYFEAIYWRKIDAGMARRNNTARQVFIRRDYWASKNPAGNTSRDRFAQISIQDRIGQAETELAQLGFSLSYLQAIQNRIRPFSPVVYLAALNRTLRSKQAAA